MKITEHESSRCVSTSLTIAARTQVLSPIPERRTYALRTSERIPAWHRVQLQMPLITSVQQLMPEQTHIPIARTNNHQHTEVSQDIPASGVNQSASMSQYKSMVQSLQQAELSTTNYGNLSIIFRQHKA